MNGIQGCMYKYNLSFVRNLTATEKSEPLESGDLLHTVFKVYYLLKIKRPDLHHDRTTEVALDFGRAYSGTLTQATDSSDEVLHHASEYFNFYEDDSLIPKHVEQSFSIILHEDKEEDFRVVYQGVVDLIAEYIQNGNLMKLELIINLLDEIQILVILLFLINFVVIISLSIWMNSSLTKLDSKRH